METQHPTGSAEEDDEFEKLGDPFEESGRSNHRFCDELRPREPSKASGFEKSVVETHGQDHKPTKRSDEMNAQMRRESK